MLRNKNSQIIKEITILSHSKLSPHLRPILEVELKRNMMMRMSMITMMTIMMKAMNLSLLNQIKKGKNLHQVNQATLKTRREIPRLKIKNQKVCKRKLMRRKD
jgi:hypothetical protein